MLKIYKSKTPTVKFQDLGEWLINNKIDDGAKFGISFKIKKRRKLRSFRAWNYTEINDSDPYHWTYCFKLKRKGEECLYEYGGETMVNP